MKAGGVGYYELVNRLSREGALRFTEPDIQLCGYDLQTLGDSFADRVAFVKKCNLHLTNIETSKRECVVETFGNYDFNAIAGNLPQAMISIDVDFGGTSNPIIYGIPDIHFFSERFLTVGVLLHELAHLYCPLDGHGRRFSAAMSRLEVLYWRWFAGK